MAMSLAAMAGSDSISSVVSSMPATNRVHFNPDGESFSKLKADEFAKLGGNGLSGPQRYDSVPPLINGETVAHLAGAAPAE